MTSYQSDIVLGDRYEDAQTGYEGVATGVSFYQHACERVCLEAFDPIRKTVVEQIFDAPRLTAIKTGKIAKVTKTGGPRPGPSRPTDGRR